MSDVRQLLWRGAITMHEAAAVLLVSVEHIAALVTIGACANGEPIYTRNRRGEVLAVNGTVEVKDADLVVRLIEATWVDHARTVMYGGTVATDDSAAVYESEAFKPEMLRAAWNGLQR